jgi:hypothetical protein
MPVPWSPYDRSEFDEILNPSVPKRPVAEPPPVPVRPGTTGVPPLGPVGGAGYDSLGHYSGYKTYWEPRDTGQESQWYKVAASLGPEDMAALFRWWEQGPAAEPPEVVKQRIVGTGLGWYDFRTPNPVGEFGYYADYLRNVYDSELRSSGYGAARPYVRNRPGFGLLQGPGGY